MSKVKVINMMLLGLITCGSVVPAYQGSELSSELLTVISEASETEVNSQSEEINEVVVDEANEESEQTDEVLEKSEQSDEVLEKSEQSDEVLEESEQASEVLEESEQIANSGSETVSNVNIKTRRASNFTGWEDNRVKGTGTRKYYVNGVINKELTYKNNIIVNRTWYHSNGKRRIYRTYNYNSQSKEYMVKQHYVYNTQGIKVDYKSWHNSGYLEIDYNYDSKGRITKREYFYSNGKTKEIRKYKNNNVFIDRKTYYPNGKLKIDYNYYPSGVRSNSRQYTSTGVYEVYRTYDGSGNMRTWEKYRSDGSVAQYQEYNSSVKLIYRLVTNNKNVKRSATTWDDKGNVIKAETWNNSGLRTSYYTYYASGKVKSNYTYHANGKIKDKLFYYANGAKKQVEYYNADHVRTLYETWYSNGKKDQSTTYYTNGKRNVVVNFNTSGVRTSYRKYYQNGRLSRNYPRYYTNNVPVYQLAYTYHSNGVIKTITRTDYTFRSERSVMTETYNTSGRQIAESSSSPTTTGYFKIPMEGYVTCQYECYSNHTGIDLGNSNKTEAIYATAPGTVVQVSGGCSNSGYLGNTCNYGAGNYVVIKHKYQGKQYFSIYMHLSKIDVKVGQSVKYTTKIGNMGSSGNSSGAHLHFEVFEDTDLDGMRSDEYRTNPAIHVDFSSRQIIVW